MWASTGWRSICGWSRAARWGNPGAGRANPGLPDRPNRDVPAGLAGRENRPNHRSPGGRKKRRERPSRPPRQGPHRRPPNPVMRRSGRVRRAAGAEGGSARGFFRPGFPKGTCPLWPPEAFPRPGVGRSAGLGCRQVSRDWVSAGQPGLGVGRSAGLGVGGKRPAATNCASLHVAAVRFRRPVARPVAALAERRSTAKRGRVGQPRRAAGAVNHEEPPGRSTTKSGRGGRV